MLFLYSNVTPSKESVLEFSQGTIFLYQVMNLHSDMMNHKKNASKFSISQTLHNQKEIIILVISLSISLTFKKKTKQFLQTSGRNYLKNPEQRYNTLR